MHIFLKSYLLKCDIFSLKDKTRISTDILHSKANWTPFEDWQAIFPSRVYRRGELIVDNGDLVLETGGQNLFS